jgi:CBS domain-containing protein
MTMTQSIREVMTPNPATIPADIAAVHAARLMQDRDIGDIIVMSENAVAGIVTDRDIAVRVVANQREPSKTTIGDICSKELHSIEYTATVEDAIQMMREKAIRRIPVMDDGCPVGIVSIGDLAIERDRESALADISAAPPTQ